VSLRLRRSSSLTLRLPSRRHSGNDRGAQRRTCALETGQVRTRRPGSRAVSAAAARAGILVGSSLHRCSGMRSMVFDEAGAVGREPKRISETRGRASCRRRSEAKSQGRQVQIGAAASAFGATGRSARRSGFAMQAGKEPLGSRVERRETKTVLRRRGRPVWLVDAARLVEAAGIAGSMPSAFMGWENRRERARRRHRVGDRRVGVVSERGSARLQHEAQNEGADNERNAGRPCFRPAPAALEQRNDLRM